MSFILTDKDYQGYGVYEHDHGMGAFGQLPDVASLQQVQIINGLAHVPTNLKPAAKAALEQMTFKQDPGTHVGGVTGTATYVFGQSGGPWVTNLVNQGLVVMVDRGSAATGTVKIVASREPNTIALMAGPTSTYVIVAANPATLAAAEAYKSGGAPAPRVGPAPTGPVPILPATIPGLPKPGDPCPPPLTGTFPNCIYAGFPTPPGTAPTPIPMPGQPAPQSSPQPPDIPPPGVTDKASALQKWGVPIAIGVGVLGIGALLLSRRKGRMRANPFR